MIKILFFAFLFSSYAHAETCFYQGTSDYSGQIEIKTEARNLNGLLHLRVVLSFSGRAYFVRVGQHIDEISVWNGQELQSVSVNQRTVIGGDIKRQQWDHWEKRASGFEGYRIQGKKIQDLIQKHPGFQIHWPLDQFGGIWRPNYQSFRPERRSDLDLPQNLISRGMKSPLASGLYWSRFAVPQAHQVPIFLTGEKGEKVVVLQVPAPQIHSNGAQLWQIPFRFGPLKTATIQPAQILISPERNLDRIHLKIEHDLGSAQSQIVRVSCQ